MNKLEILKVYNKAEKYVKNCIKYIPEHFNTVFIKNALYCAYLEGAGIKTKKIYNIIDKDKNKITGILMLIDSILKKNRFFLTVDAEIYGYKLKLAEYEVRAIQVIIHNSTDEKFEEYIKNIIIYSGPKRHEQMIFNRNGTFKNEFERGFYDINSNLMFQTLKPRTNKIGDYVITTKIHECLNCIIPKGSKVQIINIDSIKGYTIQDEEGNRVIEIGWII